MSNVIRFPLGGRDGPPVRAEYDPTSITPLGPEVLKRKHIDKAMSYIIPRLANVIELCGFDIDTDDSNVIMDSTLMLEAVKAFLLRMHGFDHPFHDTARQLLDEEANGTLLKDIRIEVVRKTG